MPEASSDRKLIEPDLDWGKTIKPEIDAAINRLLDRFVQSPFRHRCEHSLHCDLMDELQKSSDLASATIPLEDGFSTQLIHKEWPEPTSREHKGKCGNIDVSVLTPLCDPLNTLSLKSFRAGIIRPYAAIELGLDSSCRHLGNDYEKLQGSGIAATYVVHFSRRHSLDQEHAWQFITDPEPFLSNEHDVWPAFAAVFLVGNEIRIKRPDSCQIEIRLNPNSLRYREIDEDDERLIRDYRL